jgi:hypothetical protein
MLKHYLVERDIPGVGSFSDEQMKEASAGSNKALAELGADIQWVHSYIAGGKTYCVYYATSEEAVRKHAAMTKVPCTRIEEIQRVIGPLTGKS